MARLRHDLFLDVMRIPDDSNVWHVTPYQRETARDIAALFAADPDQAVRTLRTVCLAQALVSSAVGLMAGAVLGGVTQRMFNR